MPTREQFTELAKLHMDMIFRLAFSRLKSRTDADDVTQTVLLRLYETKKVFENDEHLRYWLVRITLNECNKFWRYHQRHAEELSDYVDTLAFGEPEHRDLFEAVMALDTKYRVVILLYYYEGYSVAEIAKLLHLPQGTVGTRLKRAKERLKTELTKEASQ